MVSLKDWFIASAAPRTVSIARSRRKGISRWAYLEFLEERRLMAGAASQLVFTVQPSQTAALTPMFPPIQITIEDFTGLPVTTDTSTVTLLITSNPSSGGFTQSSTITVRASGGVANFTNVAFTTVGPYTISAIDGLLAQPISNSFTVTAPATHLVFVQTPANVTAGSPFTNSISVAVEDANNNVVTTDRSNITLFFPSSQGTLTGTTTVQAVNGIATFNGVSIAKAGNYNIQARDSSLGISNGTSATFSVSAGTPASLAFAQQPINTPQSAVMNPAPVVDVLDAFGNIVTTDASTVTLSTVTQPIGGSIAGTVSVVASNGVATFSNLSFPTLGRYTLQADDGGLNGVSDTVSNSFAITGPPAELAFQIQPGQTTVGHVIAPSITVLVEDSGGNVISNDNSAVTLSIAGGPGGGTINGTTTVNAVNGVATFSGISLSAVGTYTLAASDNVLTVATSNQFLVNGLPSKLAFIQQPADGAAGAPIPGSVTVEVEDSAGNIVGDDSSLVSIVINGTGGALTGTTAVSAVHGVATFTNLVPSSAGTFTLSASDGLLTGATSNSFIVARSASKVIIIQQPVPVAATSSMPPVIIDVENGDGNIVVTNTSAVTLAIVSGPANATLSGTTTVNAVAGVATFSNLKFSTPGNYQLVAYDGSLFTDTSVVFTVSGPPTKLVFLQQPASTIIAGHTISTLTIAVRDASGNLVATDTSTVTLTGPAGTTFTNGTNGSTTSISAPVINGIATFAGESPTLAAAATNLTAADGALTSASTNKFTVIADASTAHLVVGSNPATSLVGNKFTSDTVLKVVDQFNNIVTSDNSSIVLTKTAGAGNLSGTLSVKASKGVATFSNVIASQAGPYTILATDAKFSSPTTETTGTTISFSTLVTPAITTIAAPSVAKSYNFGSTITLSDTIKSLIKTPIGFTATATIVDASNPDVIFASGTVTSSGSVKFLTSGSGVNANFTSGTHSVRVIYAGDNNHTGGQSPAFNLVVVPAATTTTVVHPSATTLTTLQTLTLTVDVNTFAGATVDRTGVIVITDNGVPVPSGTLTLASNTAHIDLTALSVGTHKFTALYEGDDDYKTSLSSALTIKVT